MAITPLDRNEVRFFHPHYDEMGGKDKAVSGLHLVGSNSIRFNAWANGSRKIVAYNYGGYFVIMIWGNGNPTMFPAGSPDRVRELTKGLNKVCAGKDLDEVRNQIRTFANSL